MAGITKWLAQAVFQDLTQMQPICDSLQQMPVRFGVVHFAKNQFEKRRLGKQEEYLFRGFPSQFSVINTQVYIFI